MARNTARSRPSSCSRRPGGSAGVSADAGCATCLVLPPWVLAGIIRPADAPRQSEPEGRAGGAGPTARPEVDFPACPVSNTPTCCRSARTRPSTAASRCRPAPSSRPRAARSSRSTRPRITALVREAVHDIQHLLRPAHLAQLRAIVDDPEASPNDRFVAVDLLRNACVSAGGVLPMCQDTGTAIVVGKRTETVLTGGNDEEAISRGIYEAYDELHLRYSQMAPTSFWDERNTGTNLPAQVELYSVPGQTPKYELLVLAKGGGSANKTFLYQETKALLHPRRLAAFLDEKLRSLGTAACPPYHLAIVVGGMSAEYNLKIAKLASARYLDTLPALGLRARPRVPRPRPRTAGAGAHPRVRHRRPVRRQVLLPRRARDPAAPARRVAPGGHRGVLLGRPPGQSQDHAGGRLPGAAGDRPRTLPARDRGRGPAERRRRGRPQPADGRDPRPALVAPGQDARVAVRPAGRGPRHRPREDRRAAGGGRTDARLPARPPRLLRGARQDPCRVRVRLVRAHHGGPHGLLRRAVPGRGRLAGDAREGQPQQAGHHVVRRARRLLPGLHRRARGPAWRRTASARSRCWSTPSSAWRPSG